MKLGIFFIGVCILASCAILGFAISKDEERTVFKVACPNAAHWEYINLVPASQFDDQDRAFVRICGLRDITSTTPVFPLSQ